MWLVTTINNTVMILVPEGLSGNRQYIQNLLLTYNLYNSPTKICKFNNKHNTQSTIKGTPSMTHPQHHKSLCYTFGATTNNPEKYPCANCNLYQLLHNNTLQNLWPPTVKFPYIPPITQIPDIHDLPEFIQSNLSSIIKQLKQNPTQIPRTSTIT